MFCVDDVMQSKRKNNNTRKNVHGVTEFAKTNNFVNE